MLVVAELFQTTDLRVFPIMSSERAAWESTSALPFSLILNELRHRHQVHWIKKQMEIKVGSGTRSDYSLKVAKR